MKNYNLNKIMAKASAISKKNQQKANNKKNSKNEKVIEITSSSVWVIENGTHGVVANAQVVFANCFQITGLKLIIDEMGRRRVKFPENIKNKSGKAYYFPTTTEMLKYISATVWHQYSEQTKDFKPREKK